MDRIGVALIGYGLAGQVFHAPLVAADPGLEVRAIVTANSERRQRAQRDFPEARLLATADELWNDTSGIGLVVVATPNHLHAPLAIAALGLGLAVVVDKPMALSTAEAGTMLEAAERAGGVGRRPEGPRLRGRARTGRAPGGGRGIGRRVGRGRLAPGRWGDRWRVAGIRRPRRVPAGLVTQGGRRAGVRVSGGSGIRGGVA